MFRPDGTVTMPPRDGRQNLMALLHRIVTAPTGGEGRTDLAAGLAAPRCARPPPWARRRRVRLPRRSRQLGAPAPPARRAPRRHRDRGPRPARARRCPTSASSRSSTRPPASSATCRPPIARLRERYAAAAAEQRNDIAAGDPAGGRRSPRPAHRQRLAARRRALRRRPPPARVGTAGRSGRPMILSPPPSLPLDRVAAIAARCHATPHVRPPVTARPPAARPCKEHR